MFRRRRPTVPTAAPGPTPPVVGPRWQGFVTAADAARARFDDVVEPVADGPLRGRLEELGEHLGDGVAGCWEAAARADHLERVVGALDPDRVTAAHKEARRRLLTGGEEASGALGESSRLLAEQHARVQALLNALDRADERLRVLQLRLDDVVLRAAELVLLRGDGHEADSLGRDLDRLVDELTALRAGLAEVG